MTPAFRTFSTTDERALRSALAYATELNYFDVIRLKAARGYVWQLTVRDLDGEAAAVWERALKEVK